MRIGPEDIKKILIINLGGIGDVLISSPAVRALKDHFPGAELYFLSAGRVAGVVRGLSLADRVFSLELERPFLHILANLKNIAALRGLRIDLGINMRTLVSGSSAGKIKYIMAQIAPRIKAGRDTEGRGYFFDVKIPEENVGGKYEMEYDLELVRALGVTVHDKSIYLPITEESCLRAGRILAAAGIIESDTLIAIHPGGKPSHRWASDNFARVMQILRNNPGRRFIITGSRDEARLVQDIIGKSGVKALNLAGRLAFGDLCAVLKRCRLYIANDTGPMHIAAVLNTPLIALFGPGYVDRYDPRNISSKAVVFHNKERCSPCNKTVCGSMKCMGSISAEEVALAAESLLGRNEKEEA